MASQLHRSSRMWLTLHKCVVHRPCTPVYVPQLLALLHQTVINLPMLSAALTSGTELQRVQPLSTVDNGDDDTNRRWLDGLSQPAHGRRPRRWQPRSPERTLTAVENATTAKLVEQQMAVDNADDGTTLLSAWRPQSTSSRPSSTPMTASVTRTDADGRRERHYGGTRWQPHTRRTALTAVDCTTTVQHPTTASLKMNSWLLQYTMWLFSVSAVYWMNMAISTPADHEVKHDYR